MIFNAKVESLNKISESVWELCLKHNEELFYFNAGQYIWIITPFGRRAFSISTSSDNPKNITLIFKDLPESEFMTHLSKVKKGDILELSGPRGTLRIPIPESNSIYVAGGVGVAPFLSILRSLTSKKISRKITLIFANSNVESQIYIKELEEIERINKDFKLLKVTSKITEQDISKLFKSNSNANWYVLGSQKFVNTVFKFLENKKVSSKNIFFEEGYPTCIDLNINFDDTSFFKTITDQSATHVVVTDINGHIVYANKAAESMTGYSFEEMKNNTPRLWGGLMDREVYFSFWNTIKVEKKTYKGELKNIRKNGEVYEVLATVSPIIENGESIGFLGMEEDITEEKRTREELKKIRDIMVDNALNKNKK